MTQPNSTKQQHDPEGLRDRATHAYESAKAKASDAVEASRERAGEAARRTADAIETNPVSVLVGGLALGAIVAAVVPRSQREKELLAPLGKRVNATAAAALAAAKDAGRAELDNLGLSRDSARTQAKSLLDGVMKAATTAGTAAAEAGREAARTR